MSRRRKKKKPAREDVSRRSRSRKHRSSSPKYASWTWYITEGSPEEDDFIFFCYVIGHEKEWGYSSLNDIKEIRGPYNLPVERDLHFTPAPWSEVKRRERIE